MPPKEQPVMTQDDGSEILPPKPKNKVRTKKAKQEPTLTAETVEKIFKKCPKLEEAFKDVADYENTIPKITMLRKADALLQDKEITQENFNSIKKLI
jgi:capsule polysaccharide export protein KpsC/LpsZ